MADDKKTPNFDPDKTVVDFPREDSPTAAPAEPAEERTVMMPRPSAPAPPEDSERTMIAPVQSFAGRGSEAEAERTSIRSSAAAPQSGPSTGFEVVCLSGQTKGRRFEIPEGGALVGSNPTCHVVIAGIETVHARITKRDADFEIQNLGAPRSIILAGGRTVTTAKMKVGDLVKIGDVVVRLVQSGQVFSAEFDEAQFTPSAVADWLAPERRLYVIGGVIAFVFLVLLLLPNGSQKPVVVRTEAPKTDSQAARRKQVDSLLAAGDVLMKEGRLFAPSDQPDAENAFAKFNEAMALDPGNERAIAAMKQIDAERDKQRNAREEERRRQEEAKRKALEGQVMAAIGRGDELFEKGQVVEPAGNNALVRYREALKIDPLSSVAQERVQKALAYYVERGDQARDRGDLWTALENYRKASRGADGKDSDIEARLRETETHLKAGMAGTDSLLIMYKDDNGRTVVLDDMDKVPARYRDRALTVQPQTRGPGR